MTRVVFTKYWQFLNIFYCFWMGLSWRHKCLFLFFFWMFFLKKSCTLMLLSNFNNYSIMPSFVFFLIFLAMLQTFNQKHDFQLWLLTVKHSTRQIIIKTTAKKTKLNRKYLARQYIFTSTNLFHGCVNKLSDIRIIPHKHYWEFLVRLIE